MQALNERWLAGEFDIAKTSFAAALSAAEHSLVLPVGAALGRGVGPVVLARPGARSADPRVLAPGEHTTATLLWRVLHPGCGELRQVVFSEIMPALARGAANLGVCIHEGRFTYQQHGLELVEDLGASWERSTGVCPAARRTVGAPHAGAGEHRARRPRHRRLAGLRASAPRAGAELDAAPRQEALRRGSIGSTSNST